jgi:hypothetical protein
MADTDWGPLIQLGVSVLGDVFAGKSEDEQKYLLERAYEQFGKIDAPALKEIAAQELGPSAMEGVKTDPALAGLQRESLDEMLRIGRSGGMTLEDKANLNDIRGQQARTTAAGNNRVREQMAARGISGGGAELAMSLANNQGAAQRASEGGLRVAADAQKRARDSIIEGGRMAGSMRGQDFGEQSQRASASDARTRYNADAKANAQRYNTGLAQQDFGNRMSLAQGRSGQLMGQADFYGQKAAGTRAQTRGYGQAVGALAGGKQQPQQASEAYDYDERYGMTDEEINRDDDDW